MGIKVKVTDSIIKSAIDRYGLAEGWYGGLVIAADAVESKDSHHIMLQMTFMPLKDLEDMDSKVGPTARFNMVTPFQNANFSDHIAPDTGGICISNMRALYGVDEIPYFPRKDKDSGIFMFENEPIDESDINKIKKEITINALNKLADLLETPAEIIRNDYFIYFHVKHDSYGANIDKLAAELPADASLVDMSSPKNYKVILPERN
ncbi:MAG: hypothetical protein HC877_18880 [Thioploca sp.]|nr:hypothetical protein [Thioploca sp.]